VAPIPQLFSDENLKHNVAARWTPHLAKDGWTPVVDAFLDFYHGLKISNTEAMFLIHLIRHKWTTRMPYPSFSKIASKMGLSVDAIRLHAKSLQKKGYLKRIERKGTSNLYDLSGLFSALEGFQIAAAKEKAADQSLETPYTGNGVEQQEYVH
jgi:DNA-binding transcriptional ArsR family regulator